MTTISVSDAMKLIYPKFTDSIPHVSSYLDDSALSVNASDSPKNIFLIGSADDGNPNNVYECTSLLQAKGIFGSGDLVNAMNMIWDAVSDDSANSGGTVFAVRVEDATQSTLTKNSLIFSSKVWGVDANKIQVALNHDSLTGGLRVEVKYPVKGYDEVYTNVGNIFNLTYSGSASAAGYTVTADDNGNATTFTLLAGDELSSAETVKTYDLTSQNYQTMAELITDINNVPGFSAESLGYANSVATSYLDPTSSTVSVSGNNGAVVTAYIGGVLYALRNDQYVTVGVATVGAPTNIIVDPTDSGATISAASADLTAGLPDDFDLTNLTGATSGTVPTSWADKIAMVQQAYTNDTEAPYYIVCLTDDSSVHAELKAYVESQANYGYNYIGFVGTGYDETVDQSIARQTVLKSPRIMLSVTSGYYNLQSGADLHVPGYMVGALAAGVASGLGIGRSLMNKYINMESIDQNYGIDDLNRLDQNGCLAIKHVINRNATGGYAFVEDVTTYCSTSDTVKNSMYLVELTDYLFDDLRYYLDSQFIGQSVASTTANLIKSNIDSFLTKRVSEGLIVSYDKSNITVTIDGNSVYITFTVDPSRAIRNVLVYGTYENYTAASSNEAAE